MRELWGVLALALAYLVASLLNGGGPSIGARAAYQAQRDEQTRLRFLERLPEASPAAAAPTPAPYRELTRDELFLVFRRLRQEREARCRTCP